jgi:hypothetical protein
MTMRHTMKRSPNLFLIGAMKAGTTSLHNYLGSHPDIFMTAEKEPTHFVDRAQLRRHWPEKEVRGYWKEAKYARLFQSARDEKIVGESSIGYALMPMFDGVAQRIKECCPDAKILYVVRHPLERAISHYWWEVNAAREATPIEKALHPESIYLKASDYAYQLADYMTYFRMENVKIVTTETLKRRPESVMSDICLGLVWIQPSLLLIFATSITGRAINSTSTQDGL